MKFYYPIISLFSILILCHSCSTKEDKYPDKVINLSPERGKTLAMEIPKSISTNVADGLELSLWASDSLVEDPIAISIDPKGRIYYTSDKASQFRI